MKKPPLIPSLMTLFFVVLMTNLGFWQLNRAQEKEELLVLLADDRISDIVNKQQIKQLSKYANIKITGHYLNAPQLLLDNQINHQVVGYHVFTPFVITDIGLIIMVNRGWVDKNKYDENILPIDTSLRTLSGKLNNTPQVGMQLGEISLAANKPIQLITYYNDTKVSTFLHEQICKSLDCLVSNKIMWLDANEKDGFKRDWNPFIMPPSKHIGYAVQWFSMTLVLIMLFIYWLKKHK
ncbi:MAG: SURF1 family protein [Proteobacteria bacterium]|nr:SURF1 family protein [Pseudomonadota bacterium]